ncbi:hypothetical protein [Myxacorys almedinensis]|uniref:Uncharacterized protein n=1 Tax=Myxacorys almedinensis A TaxID=2690445 RepID=A0A8J7Z028_9CYAN|nr:hypothetical protein [Myxacorys almedinensis]NDJ17699.1 hypothetical protein [Myxacorys almedinensis A]
MTLARSQDSDSLYFLLAAKSFLLWTFTLIVCMIVIGFPLLALVVSVGALLAGALHAILPLSGVLFAILSVIGIHAVGIMLMAGFLTSQRIHPQEVEWLRWLNGQANPLHTSIYASCPLTCDINHPSI